MNRAHRSLTLSLWLGAMAICAAMIAQTHFVSDLSAFMPRMPSERQQLLVEQLRDGIVARLVMIGIEGGTPQKRARESQALAQRLGTQAAFKSVQNGDERTQQRDRDYFFHNRYLLSPAVSAERFSPDGLRQAIGASIDALSGDAGMLLKKLLPHDPTAETLQVLQQFSGDNQPNSSEGVWASPDGSRALLLVQLNAPGTDTEAQSQALSLIRSSFESVRDGQAQTRLLVSGTSVFAVSSRATIENEVRRLAIASFLLVIGLLLLVYRSLALLLLGLVPVASGALTGVAAVSLGFGHVHALTLGFGTTLIGEAVDYSIYLFIQGSAQTNMRTFWRTIRLGVMTSTAGFAALLFSGFPGLAQLGLYSIAGLVAAALVTRFVLPLLMPQQPKLRDLGRAGLVLDRVFHRAVRLNWVVGALLLLAGSTVLYHGAHIWNLQVSALSPISAADQELDAQLRAELGAPDMRYIATINAADQESALQLAERTGAVFRRLVEQGSLGGYNSPALVLPSLATQQARRTALPDARQARAALQAALPGLPLKAERLEGFLQDLEISRNAPPLVRADLQGSSGALLLDSLLIQRAGKFMALMPLRPVATGHEAQPIDLALLHAALQQAGLSQVVLIDLQEETSSLFQSYLHEAVLLSGLGCLAIVLLLLLTLGSLRRTVRVVLPLACAVLCVTALLLAQGIQLTILHLVGLLLVVAVGSNYALFFDGSDPAETDASRRQKQTSLVVANLTTVGSFGLLGFSSVPVLSAIGSTVGPGAFLALVFSAVLARARTHAGVV
jgi:predicted exporter